MKDEKWFGAAALGSAVIASLCCVGPTVFIALGLGSLGAFSIFEQYRPLFVAITLVVLAFAFYFTYRKREIPCEDGTCEIKSGTPKAKATLWAVTVMAGVFLTSPYWLGAMGRRPADRPTLQPGTYETVQLVVEGMTCESCASHIESKLIKVPGVLDAQVKYESKEAIVLCKKGSAKKELLLEAVKLAGYSAKVKEEAK